MITVRRVNHDEWQVAKALRLKALEDSPEAFTESLAEAIATPDSVWQARIQENSEGIFSICFLAFFHTEPIGIAVGLYKAEAATEARLVSMWVAPDHRGKNVADRLLVAVVRWARQLGLKTLVAAVANNNQRAINFYARCGFEKIPIQSNHFSQSASGQIGMALDLDTTKEVERNKKIVKEFVEAINSQNWEKLAKIVNYYFVRHSSAAGSSGVKSREELITFLKREFRIFPDAQETIEDLIAEGEKVATRQRFTGTQHGEMGAYPASGKTMVAQYLAIYRLEASCIVEAWVEWDNLNGLIQLGHYIPPP